MTTRLIGIKEFRQNMSRLIREGQKKNIHFVIMRHDEVVADVIPRRKNMVTDEDLIAEGFDLDELEREIAQARREAAQGKGYSTAEVREMLGL